MEWVFFGIGCAALFMALVSFLLGELTDVASGVTDWIGDHLPFGEAGHEVGFSRLLNMGATLGFLAGFGFVGSFVMAVFEVNAVVASGWAVLGGLSFGLLLGGFWVLLRRSEGTVGYKLQDLVGKEGTVSERIYPNGIGKIVCDINDMQVWYAAKNVDGGDIGRGEKVRVQSVTGDMLYVTKIGKEGD